MGPILASASPGTLQCPHLLPHQPPLLPRMRPCILAHITTPCAHIPAHTTTAHTHSDTQPYLLPLSLAPPGPSYLEPIAIFPPLPLPSAPLAPPGPSYPAPIADFAPATPHLCPAQCEPVVQPLPQRTPSPHCPGPGATQLRLTPPPDPALSVGTLAYHCCLSTLHATAASAATRHSGILLPLPSPAFSTGASRCCCHKRMPLHYSCIPALPAGSSQPPPYR
jgi:hypothetical protein